MCYTRLYKMNEIDINTLFVKLVNFLYFSSCFCFHQKYKTTSYTYKRIFAVKRVYYNLSMFSLIVFSIGSCTFGVRLDEYMM